MTVAKEGLVSISDACQILGVSENALRQWTDDGKIRAFVTPGGHRRYAVANLKKFIGTRQRSASIKDLAAELRETVAPLREVARASLSEKAWYSKLDAELQENLASLGRNLLRTIVKYCTNVSDREKTAQTARDIGRELGERLASIGLPLTDAVEIFILHRDPIMNAATQVMKRREAATGRFIDAIPLVARVMDEALLSLVAGYQQYRGGVTDNHTRRGTEG